MHVSAPASLPAPAGSFDIPCTKEARHEGSIFAGTPQLVGGRAVLYDSTVEPDILPEGVAFTALTLRLDGKGLPVDAGVRLLLFVGDEIAPRAHMRLADLVRSGRRPLNILRRPGDLVRVALEAPVSAGSLPAFELKLLW
jgi:hypothetical protein